MYTIRVQRLKAILLLVLSSQPFLLICQHFSSSSVAVRTPPPRLLRVIVTRNYLILVSCKVIILTKNDSLLCSVAPQIIIFIKASNQRFLEESKHKSKRFLKYQVKYFFVHTNIFLYITLCTHEYFVHTTYATDFFFTYCTYFQHNVVHDKA